MATDEEGRKVWQRNLDTRGNPLQKTDNFVPFLYQGQYFDDETGLAYNSAGNIQSGKYHRSKASSLFHSGLIDKLKRVKTKEQAQTIIDNMHKKHMRCK